MKETPRLAELFGRGREQLIFLEKVVSDSFIDLEVMQFTPGFHLSWAISHAGYVLGGSAVFFFFFLMISAPVSNASLKLL